jgi:hypothetical protein
MKEDKDLAALGRLQKLAAPDQWGAISARIAAEQNERLSPRWAVAASVAAVLFLTANIFFFVQYSSPKTDNIASVFGNTISNQLYYD